MASGFTNRGKKLMGEAFFRGGTLPATFYMALVTSAAVPTADTNTLSELTEIAAGNGYTSGGLAVDNTGTDFDVSTEDDATDKHYLQIKDLVWTASGGSLPGSGNGARYAVLVDDNVTVGSRQVIAYFDLVSDRSVSVGQTLTLQNCQLDLTE